MSRAGFNTLWDISNWENGDWHSWIKIEVPHVLSKEFEIFLAFLNGKAPLNSRKLDNRGWGSTPGRYIVS